MPVNHTINVNLRSGKFGTSSRTSAKSNVRNVISGKKSEGTFGARNVARLIRTVRTADTSYLGLFGGMGGATMAVVQEGVKLANRALDIYLDIGLARTGENMSIGNIKRVKGYILNPASFVIEGTYGVWLQTMRINRQNQSNAFYRELSGNMIAGEQFRGRG